MSRNNERGPHQRTAQYLRCGMGACATKVIPSEPLASSRYLSEAGPPVEEPVESLKTQAPKSSSPGSSKDSEPGKHAAASSSSLKVESSVELGDSEAETQAELRKHLLQLQKDMSETQCKLAKISPAPRCSRAGYLRSLEELIGEPTQGARWDSDEAWWQLRLYAYKEKRTNDPNGWRKGLNAEIEPEWTDEQVLAWLRKNEGGARLDAAAFEAKYRRGSIEGLKKRGWPDELARTYGVLSAQGPALAMALRQGDKLVNVSVRELHRAAPRRAAPPLPASPPAPAERPAPACVSQVHALYNAMYLRAKSELGDDEAAPMLYRHLRGAIGSLVAVDERWATLETPDHTGFCGLCSSGITVGDCDPDLFDERGYLQAFRKDGNTTYTLQDSDVVGFVSRVEDESGIHSAVLTYNDKTGAFPPNTLFRLQHVKEKGEWEAPGGRGVFPQQRLLVVTATYLIPTGGASLLGTRADGKMCAASPTLSFGNTAAYVEGIDALIASPLLTMEQARRRPPRTPHAAARALAAHGAGPA